MMVIMMKKRKKSNPYIMNIDKIKRFFYLCFIYFFDDDETVDIKSSRKRG